MIYSILSPCGIYEHQFEIKEKEERTVDYAYSDKIDYDCILALRSYMDGELFCSGARAIFKNKIIWSEKYDGGHFLSAEAKQYMQRIVRMIAFS